MALAQRFAQLMAEYNLAIGDGKITINEAKRMLRETLAIQDVILLMKLNIGVEVGSNLRKGSGPKPRTPFCRTLI